MKSFFISPVFLLFFLLFILINYAFAIWFHLYYLIWWLDMPHHFLGGLWLILFFIFLMRRYNLNLSGDGRILALFLIFMGLVALAGVLWEFAEFGWDRFIWHAGFTHYPTIYEDTLSDLFFDLLGGAAGFFIAI